VFPFPAKLPAATQKWLGLSEQFLLADKWFSALG
jgi:hypothetical protein